MVFGKQDLRLEVCVTGKVGFITSCQELLVYFVLSVIQVIY
jgi:hypothetical protein